MKLNRFSPKVSVCITIFNEKEETVKKLFDALNEQTLKADEIILVDASASPIFNSHFLISNEFLNINVQFIHRARVSRSEGRNIAIKKAKNEMIAITDAGCVPHREWLEELTNRFQTSHLAGAKQIASSQAPRNDIVVAGSYMMIAKNNFEKAEAVFLGVKQNNMNEEFMPSARSMAFTKSIWKKAGGFPENLNDTAEDTVFNLRLIDAGAKFVVAKNAIVDWQMPETIMEFASKMKNYAKGDAMSGIWWHPVKKWRTHNLKVMTIFGRYFLAILLYRNLEEIMGIYMLYAFSKAGFWGIILQFVSDFGCIIGFSHGILQASTKRN